MHDYLKEKGVPHVWHVDGNAHDTTEWDNNLYLFSQRIFTIYCQSKPNTPSLRIRSLL